MFKENALNISWSNHSNELVEGKVESLMFMHGTLVANTDGRKLLKSVVGKKTKWYVSSLSMKFQM